MGDFVVLLVVLLVTIAPFALVVYFGIKLSIWITAKGTEKGLRDAQNGNRN